MKISRLAQIAGLLFMGCALAPAPGAVRAQEEGLPPGATRCEPSLPISVELTPLNQPAVGRPTRFGITVISILDPDLIQDMQLLYEVPAGVRMTARAGIEPQVLHRSGRTNLELGVILPDQARYVIRARLVVRLTNGKTISQTAARWVGISEDDRPEGMIGRMVDLDGTGIRVYRGETIEGQR
jgi:hypothetical protein